MRNYLTLFLCFALIITIQAQYNHNLKTNVLSLLITSPQLSFESRIAPHSSLTLSAYKGSFTFISESKIQGANLLYRYYFNGEENLSGFYPEFGFSVHGDYRFDKKEFVYEYGPRGGLGFQFGRNRWVFDLGVSMAIYMSKVDNYDENGNVTGKVWNTEPNMRLNSSVGYRF